MVQAGRVDIDECPAASPAGGAQWYGTCWFLEVARDRDMQQNISDRQTSFEPYLAPDTPELPDQVRRAPDKIRLLLPDQRRLNRRRVRDHAPSEGQLG